jgi:hypothetical protein
MPTFKQCLQRLLIILIAVDHLVLALVTLGNCVRGETISAALWSLELDGKWLGCCFRPVVDTLFYLLERDHCRASWEAEQFLYAASAAAHLAAATSAQ